MTQFIPPDGRRPTPEAVKLELGRWLDEVPWSVYFHLTFARPMAPHFAQKIFKAWARKVAMAVSTHCRVTWTVEWDPNRHHIHGLIELPAVPVLSRGRLDKLWREATKSGGATQFEQFDRTRRGIEYVVKTEGWDRNTACPREKKCRGRRGCVEAPGPW
jgi:REP element-mobilizing transposase RayT